MNNFFEWFAHSPVPVQTGWISGIISVATIAVTQWFSKRNTDKALAEQRHQFEETREADEKKHKEEIKERREDRVYSEKLKIASDVIEYLQKYKDMVIFGDKDSLEGLASKKNPVPNSQLEIFHLSTKMSLFFSEELTGKTRSFLIPINEMNFQRAFYFARKMECPEGGNDPLADNADREFMKSQRELNHMYEQWLTDLRHELNIQ